MTGRASGSLIVERFRAAIESGDMQGLMEVLAPDVVLIADGGGLVTAFRRPVAGIEKVAAALSGLRQVVPTQSSARSRSMESRYPSRPGRGLGYRRERLIEDGRITHTYAIRNPNKLSRLTEPALLSRH